MPVYYTRIPPVILLVAFLVFLPCPSFGLPGTKYLVTEVHDGDTVSIKSRSFAGIPVKIERVRLIGIDAPEIRQEPWGRRAKRHLKKLLSATDWVVHVEFDAQERDQYGRLLGYLWSKKGRLVNEEMLEDGYALLYTVPPNVRYADQMVRAEAKARSAQQGIWGKDGLRKSPQEWRREHPRDQER